MRAEFVEFNSTWHKDCPCGRHFGADTLEGLQLFFYRDTSRNDGLGGRCKHCSKQKDRIRYATPEKYNAANLKRRTSSPKKYKARYALNNAVAKGRVLKPNKCQSCSAGGRIHGHHTDYSKPLDVMWLCPKCHTKEHDNAR